MTDLFGQEIAEPRPLFTRSGKRKRDETRKGYAAIPGGGPIAETCKTCKHFCRVEYHRKIWLKCGLMRRVWSHCYATDIRAKSPACKFWTMPDPITWVRE